jgi:NAD(P)-dependent dehydrogenase (short-subunit alcohol dehydrogenase family)
MVIAVSPLPFPSTFLLTGAGRGLGYATALRLLCANPALHLVVAVRTDPDGLAARLADASGNPHVRGLACDLADLASVRSAAAELTALLDQDTLPPLHAVIANAGVQTTTATRSTADGFELTFGTNVLGHYLLLRQLLDHLTAPARIVLIGSGAHFGDFRHNLGLVPGPRTAPIETLARPWTTPDADTTTAGRAAYATSKLAAVHLTHELDRRTGPQTTVHIFDPGLMPGTGLAREGSLAERIAWNTLLHLVRLLPAATSPRASARKLAAAVLAETPAPSGSYLDRGRPVASSPASYDPQREAELWRVAAQLVGSATDAPAQTTAYEQP